MTATAFLSSARGGCGERLRRRRHVEETLENEDARTRHQAARETFDRILGKPPQAFTADAGSPLSIVIEKTALRVAGNGDGASA